MRMHVRSSWLLVVSMAAALVAGFALTPVTAHAQQISVAAKQSPAVTAVANALLQFETASRWEAMAPSWRGRRAPWIARVRAATTPAELGALTLELETIMTWAAMYPRWRQQRPGWVASARAVTSEHDAAQVLIALEAATTWNAMFENRWRPVRPAWLGSLQSL